VRRGPLVGSARRSGSRRAVVGAAFAACALACVGCDVIIGLQTPVPDEDARSPAAAAIPPEAASLASDDARAGERDATAGQAISDAGVTEAAPGIAACGDGSMACSNACADILSSSENCGACGHNCLGAPCSGGRCLPTVLSAGTPSHIAVDGTNVYWTDATLLSVMACPASGCQDAGPKTLYAWSSSVLPPAGPPAYGRTGAIAVQGSQVFFTIPAPGAAYFEDDDVLSCPTDGGASFVIGGGYSQGAVVANAQSVYWMTPENGTETWGVNECPLSGCGTGTPIDVAFGAADPNEPWAIAAGPGGVYYADIADGVGGCSSSGCACSTDDPGSCEIANSNLEAAAIAVGSASVFWASLNQVFVSTPDGSGSSPNAGVLVQSSPSSTIEALAVDDENVYFTTDDDGGSIYSCAVNGCGDVGTLVASNLTGVGDIKVDAHRIYAVVGTEVGASVPPGGGLGVVWIAK